MRTTVIAMATAAVLSAGGAQALDICKTGDTRTKVPVWTPRVGPHEKVSTKPPAGDGLIVYIRLAADNFAVECSKAGPQKPDKLYVFREPEYDVAREAGQLINIRGNVQFANGSCYFSGFYMNEPVFGSHQGQTETYFGAVPKTQVALSGAFCLDRPIE